MAGINTLSTTLTVIDNWNASFAAPSTALPLTSLTNTSAVTLPVKWPTSGAAASQCNEVAVGIQSIAANTSATINMQNLTDVLNQTAVVLVRLKKYIFCNLSTTQDATGGANSTSVVIGNAASLPHPLDMSVNTTTKTLSNGDVTSWGTATAAGVAVNTTTGGCNIKIANSDLTNTAAVYYSLAGATS